MFLIDDAVIIEIFGIRMYAFGVYVALGALCALAVISVMTMTYGMKSGSAAMIMLFASVFGILFSRIAFCLMNRDINMLNNLHAWPQINSGGWSMFGLIGGVFIGGRISAAVLKQNPGKISDILCLALLPFMTAERIAENRIDYFDVSRSLDSEIFQNSFLAVGDGEPVLATYYITAACMSILFVILMIYAIRRKEQDGKLTIRFTLLFGSVSIITESLRYDFFLSISFVGLQQVAAAITLAVGVILAVKRSNRPKSVLTYAAISSIPIMTGIIIGLEFALDRTMWNKILVYCAMIITVSIPAGLGMKLLSQEKGNEKA